jgi:hypothetical protein
MSTRIDGAEAALAYRAIRIRLAAAIGLILLALGLTIGLIVGGLLTRSDQQPASASVRPAAPSPAKVPTLSWKDDYGTRHPLAPPKPPAPSWKDDYGTRHPNERP